MTFAPERVITDEEWKKRHQGHKTRTVVEEIVIKRIHWLVCEDCGARHLFKMEMETVPVTQEEERQ